MEEYKLFIDESGTSDINSKYSDFYILCGCSIAEHKQSQLKIFADQIKFKYWGRTDVVFHSREIGKNLNDFAIFNKNDQLKKTFLKDVFNFLKKSPVTILIILVDKKIAKGLGWNYVKVLKETSKRLIYHFITLLLSNSNARGKIVIESATAEKDLHYLNAFSYFLSPGLDELSVDYKEIRKILTSISFVTKDNHDIEEQIADLFAYAAKCKYQARKKEIKLGDYEKEMVSILSQKLFSKPAGAKERKMKFYEKIESFCVLPKT